VLVLTAACSSPDESVVADQALPGPQPSVSVTSVQPDVEADDTVESTTTTASTSGATTSTTTDPQVAAPPPLADDLEVRGSPVKLLFFNSEGAFELDTYGDVVQIVEGPISEIADDGLGGVVFQRPGDEQRIWWLPVGAGEPSVVVEVEVDRFVKLEGVNVGAISSELIYQRLPRVATLGLLAEGTLQALDLATGLDTELDVTDGHEHTTSIIQVRNGLASGAWSTETNGVYLYDLVNRVVVYNPSLHASPELGDADGVVVARDASSLLSVQSLPDESGFADRIGLISREIGSDGVEIVAEYEWGNADWYPTGLEIGDGLALVSRSTAFDVGTSEPARPLLVDLATGDSWLLPVEANVRLRHRFEVRVGDATDEPTASSVVSTDGFDVAAADGSLMSSSPIVSAIQTSSLPTA